MLGEEGSEYVLRDLVLPFTTWFLDDLSILESDSVPDEFSASLIVTICGSEQDLFGVEEKVGGSIKTVNERERVSKPVVQISPSTTS